ncbi:hypothetical protein N7488_010632 [Penicillium malachiteum]|nr:hypothetical protein N7488_010632 [Penicillium malachiteum]
MSLLLAGFNRLEYWLATFIPIPLIDRLGRRSLLLFAAVGQAISMAVLAGSTAYPNSTACGIVATVFLFVFNTFFGIGFDGIPFLLPVELTPLQTRTKSVSIATGCFWLCIPETLNGTLEDTSVLFEESEGAWLIGPSSRKKLASIIANREATEAHEVSDKEGVLQIMAEHIENDKLV